MDPRFIKAHKEACWSFGLTLGYFFCWWILFYFSYQTEYLAYFTKNFNSITGLPLWFEISCIAFPLVFIMLCILMIKLIFCDVSLENIKD